MEAQYDGLVSGDADRGKKGSTLGVTARAQWRGSRGMKPDTWIGLEHKAWETVLFLQDNEDLDVIPYLSLQALNCRSCQANDSMWFCMRQNAPPVI